MNHDFFLKETIALAYVSLLQGASEPSSLGAAYFFRVFLRRIQK
jgi:hypothetical protein